jgi:peptidoglycan-associated lipoprotein
MGAAAALMGRRPKKPTFEETRMRIWIIVAIVAALAAGCKSTETQAPAPIDDKAPAAAATAAPGASTSGAGATGVTGTPMSPLKDPKSILSKRTVYFDYDSYVVKDEYRAMVEAHSKYLQTNKPARVTLQGHADERGSREYNIALGQKRADAVKKLMQLLGATDIQIETVSFGKEKPKAEGHDEASWAQNRRVELIYVGE